MTLFAFGHLTPDDIDRYMFGIQVCAGHPVAPPQPSTPQSAPQSAQPSTPPSSHPPARRRWTEARRRLSSARWGIDGRADGAVKFHCRRP